MTAAYDVIVVGAGPAGSVAALVLAGAGARVALMDKATFPRDKACGDLLGPRGVQLLADIGIDFPLAGRGSDMLVQGPGGARIRLPAYPGLSYPGYGVIVPRRHLDAGLREAALRAGAEPVNGRVVEVDARQEAGSVRLTTAAGRDLAAGIVVGADGALSTVAKLAGLVDERHALWGFALRGYLPADVAMPMIALFDQQPGAIFPGYGWLFPGEAGAANVGIGVGAGHGRQVPALRPVLGRFLDRLRATGDLPATVHLGRLTGGWLKMGMVGTIPARDRVLLVGDAAGLINPLQGEGIGPAVSSGALAARAILADPAAAAVDYRASLRDTYGRYAGTAATLQSALLRHPRLTSSAARTLTALQQPLVGGTWSLVWNDLIEGATPRPARTAARTVSRAAALLTARSATARRLDECLQNTQPSVPVRTG